MWVSAGPCWWLGVKPLDRTLFTFQRDYSDASEVSSGLWNYDLSQQPSEVCTQLASFPRRRGLEGKED